MGFWGRYVTVAERRRKAQKQIEKLKKKGKQIFPVEIEGRTITRSFWGKAWCSQVNSFSDYVNRLPRGRTYVRNGSISHLDIHMGEIEAIVSGSSLYEVHVQIDKLSTAKWENIRQACSGQIGSFLELLQGKLSKKVLEIVTDIETGLFPTADEIEYTCSCPDWAGMCKHVAAVLYGVANRLDSTPELLFVLRGVEAKELISSDVVFSTSKAGDEIDDIAGVFGIELEEQQVETQTGKKQSHQAAESSQKPFTGQSIQKLRHQLGLSIVEFANELKVTPVTVCRWEAVPGVVKLRTRSRQALLEKVWITQNSGYQAPPPECGDHFR